MDSKYYSEKLIQNTCTQSIASTFDVLSIKASKSLVKAKHLVFSEENSSESLAL